MIGIGIGMKPWGAQWTPKRLGASLALWLRADQGLSLNGSSVTQWSDLSGNNRNFTQGTAIRQPQYQATGLAGRPSVFFDGSNDMVSGATFTGLTTSADFFAVMRLQNDPPSSGFGAIWQIASPTGTEDYIPFFSDGRIYCGLFSTSRKSTNVQMGAGYFSSSPRIFSVYSAASDWRMLTDGVERYNTSTNTFNVTSTNAIGGDPENAGYSYHGHFAEFIVASPSLSSTQRAQVYKYLGKRYGITVP